MLKQNHHIALLFFTRTATAEAAHKKIVAGTKRQNRLAIEILIKRTRSMATRSCLPFFVHTEQHQRGNSFGEKLSSSVTDIFNQGYQKIIIIGNDCLQLSTRDIIFAASQLNDYDQVLAPTKNGGVYLLGLNKESFHKQQFEAIHWQSVTVFNDLLLAAGKGNHAVYTLPALNDINNYYQFVQAIKNLATFDSLRLVFKSIIASLYKEWACLFFQFNLSLCLQSEGLRAPPPSFK